MKRLEFLMKARQIACQQINDSSCLTDEEFKDIMESDDEEEVALYRRASEILTDASHDMAEHTLKEIEEIVDSRSEED